ncbi:RbsD/FucU family protein [Marinobacterium rhizophilum]|uniref:Ribose ABC transporter n=1 Tax=Marinobacterium rhizophilum TaxID=420402 RepID=A0ABY5HI92_9GAMM|nr:RbsD/FucU domain-containing protein [Marinobacterium rhizophilum]UTW12106.1 ribose ABC transporter [Marinobacterium rhizophilum]
MLRNIPSILSPELLYTLCAMGHGDEIVIADANFPAHSAGPTCIRLDGASATAVLQAVLAVMPLDAFEPVPALTMQVVGNPDSVPDIVADFQSILDAAADHPAQLGNLERFAFYERARSAFAIIQTGEHRLYGNIILKKGVIEA